MEAAGGQQDGPVGMEAAGGQQWPWWVYTRPNMMEPADLPRPEARKDGVYRTGEKL